MSTRLAAGIFPVFDSLDSHDGKIVLLGKEYRSRYSRSFYMEFGGKHENGESLAETALREFKEETAFSIPLDIETVNKAERFGHYIDYYGPMFFYRMYFIYFGQPIHVNDILLTSKTVGNEFVEKSKYKYFDLQEVVLHKDGMAHGKELYPSLVERLNGMRRSSDFNNFLSTTKTPFYRNNL